MSLTCVVIFGGMPIDMFAGTSIGTFVGALYCEERNFRNVEKRAREWAKGMASLWGKNARPHLSIHINVHR